MCPIGEMCHILKMLDQDREKVVIVKLSMEEEYVSILQEKETVIRARNINKLTNEKLNCKRKLSKKQ